MRSISVVIPVSLRDPNFDPGRFSDLMELLASQAAVARIILACQGLEHDGSVRKAIRKLDKIQFLPVDSWISSLTMMRVLVASESDGLLLSLTGPNLTFERHGIEKFMEIAELSNAGVVYSDYRQIIGNDLLTMQHPTTDYQIGSIRDSFDFGPLLLISKPAASEALRKHGPLPWDVRWNGFYDLRLKLSIDHTFMRVAEPLYVQNIVPRRRLQSETRSSIGVFYIQDRSKRDYVVETERIAIAHLRRVGAYIESGSSPPPAVSHDGFPVTASIVIPTRNREKTLSDAIESALKQSASFAFNIIIVDDHSTDRSAEIIQRFCRRHENIFYIVPTRGDLGIGGLWNEAIYSSLCGLYAIQLDSDDVYAHDQAIETIVNEFTRGHSDGTGDRWEAPLYAMVLGSFTSVNAELREIPPGLSQRLELSRENVRNNLLCVDGASAPRAFYVPVLRRFGFPNVSFGEDYAIALRISREYDVGRVFDSIYLVRSWDENTTHTLPFGSLKSIGRRDLPRGVSGREDCDFQAERISLPLAIISGIQYNGYKDYLRTIEVQARKGLLRRPNEL